MALDEGDRGTSSLPARCWTGWLPSRAGRFAPRDAALPPARIPRCVGGAGTAGVGLRLGDDILEALCTTAAALGMASRVRRCWRCGQRVPQPRWRVRPGSAAGGRGAGGKAGAGAACDGDPGAAPEEEQRRPAPSRTGQHAAAPSDAAGEDQDDQAGPSAAGRHPARGGTRGDPGRARWRRSQNGRRAPRNAATQGRAGATQEAARRMGRSGRAARRRSRATAQRLNLIETLRAAAPWQRLRGHDGEAAGSQIAAGRFPRHPPRAADRDARRSSSWMRRARRR